MVYNPEKARTCIIKIDFNNADDVSDFSRAVKYLGFVCARLINSVERNPNLHTEVVSRFYIRQNQTNEITGGWMSRNLIQGVPF